jgi:hypothetical protein
VFLVLFGQSFVVEASELEEDQQRSVLEQNEG